RAVRRRPARQGVSGSMRAGRAIPLRSGGTSMSTRQRFLFAGLLGAAWLLAAGPAEAQVQSYGRPAYRPPAPAGQHMPGWDWWRTYPWSPYNYGRNPYNPIRVPYVVPYPVYTPYPVVPSPYAASPAPAAAPQEPTPIPTGPIVVAPRDT